jgi:glutathione synthase
MYAPNFHNYQVNNAPITLFPTPLPKTAFKEAVAVQKVFQELYINIISKNESWLCDILQDLSSFDPEFTGKLFETYLKAKPHIIQPLSLGLFRSDYFIDQSNHQIKQIEFNTVSVSFGGLSTKIGQLHQYLNKSGKYDSDYSNAYYDDDELQISNSANELAKGLADADSLYSKDNSTVVIFIVQPNERNCFDQRHIEYSLLENHNIKSYRFTLDEVESKLTVNSSKLYVKATMDEVSVVYYRSGYAPSDYTNNPKACWDARLFLETSAAIKCPSLLTQLSGAKKIQQILTDETILKKFLPSIDPETLRLLISTFVDIYPLDDSPRGLEAQKLAFESPEKFVLKPQREGGGNNIYKENIPDFLKSLPKNEWQGYILMELIEPPLFKNKIIRNDEVYNEEIISELGIFGTILFNEQSGEIISNENAGWLLRSKFSSSNEGGVAAGFGCVDNVYLYDE